ncbi:MAG TPA: hypothetical protein VIB49_09500 [Thermoplasmata archaeon]|jgi:hypothetical protein
MGKRDEAALKLLLWELEGRGDVVMEAMLRHPDMNLADAVDLVEQEVPGLSPRTDAPSPPEGPPPRPRPTSELDALDQEFQTFRHLLTPRQAKEVELELRSLTKTHDREGIGALRRRLRSLSLQASFWSELATRDRESNVLALMILVRGRSPLAKAGETAYLDESEVSEAIRRESARQGKGTYVMHLPVGRLVVMNGDVTAIAALFRRAPGKDVVSVLTKTVEAIEENKAAAARTFGNEALASRYAEALLKLLQKTSL